MKSMIAPSREAPSRRSASPAVTRGPAAMPAVPTASRAAVAQADELRGLISAGLEGSAAGDGAGVLQAKDLRAKQPPEQTRATAAAGLSQAVGPLPYLDRIQQAFGGHDVSGVRSAVGGRASDAAAAIGARAWAMGERIGFAETPDLFTAAHEAAHVVQQREGVQVAGGVGQSGDAYEKHADAVAQRVVEGRSAADLLARTPASATASSAAMTPAEVLREQQDTGTWVGPDTVQMVRAETTHLENPFTHPEWPAFESRCATAGIAGARSLWPDICGGILDNDQGRLDGVATRLVGTLVSSPNKLALWSGGDPVRTYAEGRGFQTLESTRGGQIFNGLKLLNQNQWSWPKVRLLWGAISRAFARQARGEVNCFMRYPGYVFTNFESPEIQSLVATGAVTVKYHAMALKKGSGGETVHELRSDGEIAARSNSFGTLSAAMAAVEAYKTKYGPN